MSTPDSGDSLERLANLSREQRVALFQRLKEKQRDRQPSDGLVRRQNQGAFPLSFAQLRLWFLDSFEPGSAVYNIPQALRLRGFLRLEVLQQALAILIERHEILRTTFVTRDGEPQQIVAEAGPALIPLVNLQDIREAEREAEVQRLANLEAHRPFDLMQGPLLRVTVLRLGAREHILLLTVHHIISDAWSGGIFLREFFSALDALSLGAPVQLPELPIQYGDFVLWQRQQLHGAAMEEQLSYWKTKLAGVPMLQLPTDHPRPALQTFRGAAQSLELDSDLTSSLHALSRQEGATLFMTLLAAFKTLLYRYTWQEDLAVGSLIANRNRAEIEGLIGFFVNTLVLRTDLSLTPTFRELLRREREVCLEAYAHQDLPFEQLVDALQPERSLSYSPLFQVLFTLQNIPPLSSSSTGQAGLEISSLATGTATSKFDLSLFCSERQDGLQVEAEYNTDLFEPATIQRMLEHFRNLLESIVANPDGTLATYALLSQDERQQLLVEWNQTQTAYPQNRCLHELIQEQVKYMPDAIAAVFEGHCLTYRELDSRANQLAHYFCNRCGVGPEALIGISLDRSLEMLIGILGILKAGAAYLPLDPEYPRERLAFVLEDTRAPVLITSAALSAHMPEYKGATLWLERDWEHIAQEATYPPRSVTVSSLAYTIYTSGSTGKPKGVQITHQAVVNFLSSMREHPGLTQQDTLLAVTSISFDIAGLELFLPLLVGARLEIANRSVTRDGEQLRQLLSNSGATIMQATPATWQLLLEAGWRSSERMRMLCGGEALSPKLARQLRDQNAPLWNMYGPTETTIWSALHQVEAVEGNVPLGRPIANTQIYLLDECLNPVPIGVAGDLYIGGAGLSRGYLRRPDATAERFLPHPWSEEPGARLYKTGDLARYLADGTLEFLGRNDYQVKIRGFRIELQEIETILEQHPSVRECVVVAREDTRDGPGEPTDRRLVAYIVPHTQHSSTTAEAAWQDEQISQWQTVWDTAYGDEEVQRDPVFDLSGWRSSYTHEPIPEMEMREWVDSTVARIRAHKPRHILEIGCGTGLLLFRLAPHCSRYCGTDFSSVVLDKVRREAARRELFHVKLLERAANDFTGIEAGEYDLVVLNSVVQYFPSVDYLMQVLEQAIQLVAPHGSIFLGDVRNLSLLELFHTSIQVHQAAASLTHRELQRLVQSQVAQEKELTIDPAFFAAVQQRFPRVKQAFVQLKRGHSSNELTSFRYDVVLHMDSEAPPIPQPLEMDWQRDGLTLESIRKTLLETAPDALRITGIPNARLAMEVRTLELLKSEDGPETVEALREATRDLSQEARGIDPEDFWALEDHMNGEGALPYTVTITWSEAWGHSCYDVVLLRKTAASSPGEKRLSPLSLSADGTKLMPWSTYTNNPLQERFQQKLVPELRDYLKEKLPDYMIPSAILLLQALPLTPNGKVDRRALPAPGHSRPGLRKDYLPPRTQTEQALAEIWEQVLGVERVGVHDNFFDLGGNSLLVIRVVARANKAGLTLTTKQVFQHQTVAKLATAVGTASILTEQGLVAGPTPSTPGQRFVLSPSVHNPHYFNLAYFVSFRYPLDPVRLQRVVQELLLYHDALRLHLAPKDAGFPLLTAAPSSKIPFICVDLSRLSEQTELRVMHSMLHVLQQNLDLRAGPLFTVVLFKRGPGRPDTALLLGHYLVADIESWQILLGDLLSGYQQLTEKGSLSFPPKPTSFKQWAERLKEYAQLPAAAREFPYWLAEVGRQMPSLPRDYPEGVNIIDSSRTVETELAAAETSSLLGGVLKRYDVQMDAVLLMALAWALGQWTGRRALFARLFTHGREPLFDDMDVSRTVGALATDFPISLDLSGARDEAEALQMVKTHLQQIPQHGIGYGILRVLGRSVEAETLRAVPEPEVVVNYIAEDSGETPKSEVEIFGPFTGHYLDPQSDRTYTFQITGRVLEGKLRIQWDYSEHLHRRSTVEFIAQNLLQVLRSLIAQSGKACV